jgi:hypothetical protein
MNNLTIYLFYTLCVLLILIYLILKLKYKFWILQPVFHYYDFPYWFYNKGVIQDETPKKNKYVNNFNIITYNFNDLDKSSLLNKFHYFIRKFYFQSKDNYFDPLYNNIIPYLDKHNDNVFLSFYYESKLFTDKSANIIDYKNIIGVMCSRPLVIHINKIMFDIYYVDYLCIDKTKRNIGIAPQVIQTHEYNQRHTNHNIKTSLFKREGELTGIVPLCVYTTYCYKLSSINFPREINNVYKILSVDSQNIYLLNDFFKNEEKFIIKIYPCMANLLNLIESKNIKINIIMKHEEITCIFFYRKTCTFINKNEIVSCFASYKSVLLDSNEFTNLFLHSLKQFANLFSYISIENISDNHILVSNFENKYKNIACSPYAYFFYNYAYRTLHPNKVIIIN